MATSPTVRALLGAALVLLAVSLLLASRCDERVAKAPMAAPNVEQADAQNATPSAGAVVPAVAPPSESSRAWTPRRIAKFDVHLHIDADVATPARGFLESYGIGGGVNLSGGTPGEGLEETLAAARAASGYYVVFVNVDFRGIGTRGWAEREVLQLEKAKKMGARGVKIFKNLGLRVAFPDGRRVPVDDPVLDPLFDAMARLNMPLAIHVGDPKAFFEPMGPNNERMDELATAPSWSFADRTKFPTWQSLYDEFERRVKRSSKTTIIGVHFGNDPEDPDRVLQMMNAYPNLYVDTAARVPEIGRKPEATRRAILAHPDRVLFGTDTQLGAGMIVLGAGPARGHTRDDVDHFFTSTWEFFETSHKQFAHPTPIQGNWKIDGIELPPDVLENVYHKNAERLLGLPPTPLPPAAPLDASDR